MSGRQTRYPLVASAAIDASRRKCAMAASSARLADQPFRYGALRPECDQEPTWSLFSVVSLCLNGSVAS